MKFDRLSEGIKFQGETSSPSDVAGFEKREKTLNTSKCNSQKKTKQNGSTTKPRLIFFA